MASRELRCSVQSNTAGADPIGTAGAYDAYLLIELPLPWTREITEDPRLAEVVRAVAATGVNCRILGLVMDHEAAGTTRVIAYRRPPGAFRAYDRQEWVAATGDLVATCNQLLTDPVVETESETDDEPVTDLLVCTHGARDRCCGSFGMNLFTAIGARYVRQRVRTWRVSHTGGHRFAPTAIFLPAGHLWAWLDDELVEAILQRTRPPSELIEHYRGSSAMGSPPVQVVERELFARLGWDWLDARRQGAVVERDGDRHHVRIDFVLADGEPGACAAVVEQVGTIAQPVCGEPPSEGGKADPVWALAEFAAVEPAVVEAGG